MDLENRIHRGDRDAMVEYLKNAFAEETDQEELRRIFKFVLGSDHGYDAAVMRNLGLVAAASDQCRFALNIADDLYGSDLLADAMHVNIAVIDRPDSECSETAWLAIERLSERGHIRSQVFLKKRRMSGSVVSRLYVRIFQVLKVLQATVILVRNRSDPRIGV